MFDLFKCQMKGIICVHMQKKYIFTFSQVVQKVVAKVLLSGAFFSVGLRDKITVGNLLHASLLTLQW